MTIDLNAIASILLEHGLLGLGMLVVGFAYWRTRTKLDAFYERVIDLAVEREKAATTALERTASSLSALADEIRRSGP